MTTKTQIRTVSVSPSQPRRLVAGDDRAEQAVDTRLRVIEKRPNQTGDHLGEDVREKEDGPEKGAPAQIAANKQRQPERQRQLRRERQRQDDQVVLERGAEDLVLEHAVEIVQPDVILERPQPFPSVEPVVTGLEQREEDEERIDRRRGQEKETQPWPPCADRGAACRRRRASSQPVHSGRLSASSTPVVSSQ